MTVLSLDPDKRKLLIAREDPESSATVEDCHGWLVLGKREVTSPDERRQLVRALYRGVTWPDIPALGPWY